MTAATREQAALYPRLLGPVWLELHPTIRRHLTADAASGRFEFRRGRSLGARLTCRVLRLPSSETALDTRLAIARRVESETWSRALGHRLIVTIQRGLPDGTLAERFGALEFCFHLRVIDGALTYVQASVALMVGPLRIPLPRLLSPRVEAREVPIGERGVYVRVRISAPGIGLLISYEGCVEVEGS